MNWFEKCFWVGLLAGLAPMQAWAQAGDGLKADYYDGHNFEKLVLTRHDAAIDFNWHQRSPAANLPPEDFSVRWTGWLMPPTTGRYVLHISVDDGMRLWLDGRQLLNDWRGQPLSFYQVEVELQAGRPYALRIDYCQYSADSRALLAWELPGQTPPPSWRNLWGRANPEVPTAAVPTRYLFSKKPASQPATLPPVAPATAPVAPVVAKPQPVPPASALRPIAPPARVVRHSALAYVAPAARPTPAPPPAQPTAAAVRTATRLANGQAVTLRALYFEQGKADLPPAVQASLDTLASALLLRPTLRLEVQGHTDNQGDSAINRQLSQHRAEAVCRYLAAQGVAATRLRAVGYGGTRPVADNRWPGLRPRNRRVVLQAF